MNDPDTAEYDGGYSDGISDAINAVARAEGTESAIVLLKKLQGYVDCPSCSGTGERKEVTELDLIKALIVTAGGRTDLGRPCTVCWGNRVVLPKVTERVAMSEVSK